MGSHGNRNAEYFICGYPYDSILLSPYGNNNHFISRILEFRTTRNNYRVKSALYRHTGIVRNCTFSSGEFGNFLKAGKEVQKRIRFCSLSNYKYVLIVYFITQETTRKNVFNVDYKL